MATNNPLHARPRVVPMPARLAMTSGPDLVPLAEVAARMNLTTATIKRLHHTQGLPLTRVGKSYYAIWSSIESWARQYERP